MISRRLPGESGAHVGRSRREIGTGSAPGRADDDRRALLAAQRAEVVARLATAESDVDRIIGAGQDVATDDEHDPEGVGLAVERALAVAALERARSQLARIEEAEARLSRGEYGRCTGCGRPIPAERLQVLPTTTTCTDCSRAGQGPG